MKSLHNLIKKQYTAVVSFLVSSDTLSASKFRQLYDYKVEKKERRCVGTSKLHEK